MSNHSKIRVTAIISIYKAAHDIEACLEDLIAQDLFQQGELEIVCIDAASPENEKQRVGDLVSKHPQQISWHRLESRVGLYTAWNFAIERARGEFITNANTDDRHANNCIRLLMEALENDMSLGMVYGSQKTTRTQNANFEDVDYRDSNVSPRFFAPNLLLAHPCGCQPMFRKSVWQELGGFDESYEVIGDYEFTLRVAVKYPIKRVDEAWGLFRIHDSALSKNNLNDERQRLEAKYWNFPYLISLYKAQGLDLDEKSMLCDFFLRSLAYYHIWEGNKLCRQHVSWSRKILEIFQANESDISITATMRDVLEIIENPTCESLDTTIDLSGLSNAQLPGNHELLNPLQVLADYSCGFLGFQQFTKKPLLECTLGFPLESIQSTVDSLTPGRPVYIYGAGQLAVSLVPILESMEVSIEAITDRYAASFRDYTVVSHESVAQDTDAYFFPGTWDLVGYTAFMQSHGRQPDIDYFLPPLERPFDDI